MPLYDPGRMTAGGWIILATLAAAAACVFWNYPWWLVVIPGLGLLHWDATRKDKRRLAKFIGERADESICNFARSFDTTAVDTWVIRAVYEEIQSLFGRDWHSIAIRADDNLTYDLELDDEDIDLSLVDAIAQRTGRSLDGYEQNSYYGKVYTARDLVMFFNEQPLASDTAGTAT